MQYIKSQLSEDLAKKILGSKARAKDYLFKLGKLSSNPAISYGIVSRGQNAGKEVLVIGDAEVWKVVVDTWNYETGVKIIRDLFRSTEKYKRGKSADRAMAVLLEEWSRLGLGPVAWPFSQGAFDDFVQSINSLDLQGSAKDERAKAAAVKYRRIKEINTVRNDFIETLIFEKNTDILPTLNHRRGIDFFIDGVSFDQKVAKSPTNEFKRKYKNDWREKAIKNPELVAEYLYKYQDEGRFGADPRLLVVYIDEDVSVTKIREKINSTNLNRPTEISFTFKHKIQGDKTYKVPCFIILLHN